jgi:hypothetical protein
MSYSFYKILHVFGIAMLLVSLGGVFVHAANGAEKNANVVRRLVLILHGIGSFLILLAGFGLLARLGETSGFPGWVWPKLAIWAALSAAIAIPYRSTVAAKLLFVFTPILVFLAALFAVLKPL